MTLAALAALLFEVLGAIAEAVGLTSAVLTVVNAINQQIPTFAREHVQYSIAGDAQEANLAVNDLVFGNSALRDLIIASNAAIALQITDLTDGTTPVSLPVIPPSGYASGSLVDIADAVWNNPQTALPTTPADAMQQVARSLNTTADFDMPLFSGIFRVSRIDWPTQTFYITSIEYPTFDPTDILATDTLLSCLTRQNPTWNLGYPWGPQTYVGLDPTSGGQAHYTTLIDEAAFSAYKASLGIGSTFRELSLWPGIANVTLGAPVALAAAVDVDVPMNGAIITLTSVPPDKPHYTIGSLVATAHIGQIAFKNDNDDMEYPQNLSFPSEVYIPTTMVLAAGVKVRCVPGVAGTVTPYTIT